MYAMLRRSKNVSFQTFAAGYVEDQSYGLVYLDLNGPEEATRAIWSHLVKGRKGSEVVDTNAYIYIPGSHSTHPIRVHTNLTAKKIHEKRDLVMLHPGLIKTKPTFILGGDEGTPSPWFRTYLERQIDIPILPEWVPALWRAGIKDVGIKKCSLCLGLNGWRVHTSSVSWQATLQDLYKSGEIHG